MTVVICDYFFADPYCFSQLNQFIMALPDDSWHLKYYESSYLYYILFTACIVAFYIGVYCLKVPTRRFTNLKEILENDPVINSYKFRLHFIYLL